MLNPGQQYRHYSEYKKENDSKRVINCHKASPPFWVGRKKYYADIYMVDEQNYLRSLWHWKRDTEREIKETKHFSFFLIDLKLTWEREISGRLYQSDLILQRYFYFLLPKKGLHSKGTGREGIKHDRGKEEKEKCHLEEDPCASLPRFQAVVFQEAACFGVGTKVQLENRPGSRYNFWDDAGSSTGDARYGAEIDSGCLAMLLKLSFSQ